MSSPVSLGPVVIAGGNGFLGHSLAAHLVAQGFRVIVLSRSRPAESALCEFVHWDARTVGAWRESLNGAIALVNLVGRSVDCIKTPARQDEILRSRVEATRALGQAQRRVERPPQVWVQMSTAHAYGDPPEVWCDEDSPLGMGLAPQVAREWEAAAREGVLPEQRQVILRTSFVIGRDGGALPRLLALVRWGLGGRVGPGTQGMSWIHTSDLNRLCERAITDAAMQGVYIASAPEPVSQAIFMRALRRAAGMPIGLPAPAWLVRLGAPLLMHTDPDLALYGRYVVSRRLREQGFEFRFPRLEPALADVLCKAG